MLLLLFTAEVLLFYGDEKKGIVFLRIPKWCFTSMNYDVWSKNTTKTAIVKRTLTCIST